MCHMAVRPLAAALTLVLADWGLWTWSIGSDHGNVSLIAGLVMAPLFVALIWLATMAVTGGLRSAAERVRRRNARVAAPAAQLPRRREAPEHDRLVA